MTQKSIAIPETRWDGLLDKILFLAGMLLLSLCFGGCREDNHFGIGMTKSQIVERFGQPVSVRTTDLPILDPKEHTEEEIRQWNSTQEYEAYVYADREVIFNCYSVVIGVRLPSPQ